MNDREIDFRSKPGILEGQLSNYVGTMTIRAKLTIKQYTEIIIKGYRCERLCIKVVNYMTSGRFSVNNMTDIICLLKVSIYF